MSEMDLGGEVKLTVPQLRVYLSCMKRLADSNRFQSLAYASGINKAVEELLKCLNLSEDWAERMDKKEVYEVLQNMTSEERREAK